MPKDEPIVGEPATSQKLPRSTHTKIFPNPCMTASSSKKEKKTSPPATDVACTGAPIIIIIFLTHCPPFFSPCLSLTLTHSLSDIRTRREIFASKMSLLSLLSQELKLLLILFFFFPSFTHPVLLPPCLFFFSSFLPSFFSSLSPYYSSTHRT
ncbi:uncharacterized protein RJT20DRAFT_126384, partial [Scheffersomyces xylosifermentans]|uniref:uncharacterized protein n=1 Tax=Scheffersomyces xylosifermentans TaxID=1304137 RepID=UPI00315DA5EE